MKILPKPEWLKAKYNPNEQYQKIADILKSYNLNTVCDAANCPNRGECHNNGTATFMLLGKHCTRNCTFCNVTKAKPEEVDVNEAKNIALAVKQMNLKHIVITSVTRDDLIDGGARHFANTIEEIKRQCNNVTIEVLIPDFKGHQQSLEIVINTKPHVLNHNIETVPQLYSEVRPMANYFRSLKVIKSVKFLDTSKQIATKSGFMVGLGETKEQVLELLQDLREADCDIVTIGQYLRPSKNHFPVYEYVTPETFANYKHIAEDLGFKYVASGPFVRSSYNAHLEMEALKARK